MTCNDYTATQVKMTLHRQKQKKNKKIAITIKLKAGELTVLEYIYIYG